VNIDQYKRELRLCQKRMIWQMFAAIGVMFAVLLVGLPIRPFLDPLYQPFLGPTCVLLGLPMMLVGFRAADVAFRKFPKLICPHCEGGLHQSKSVVIATGNCPGCGRRVLADSNIGI
jgi:hypothetical protein